jgi:pyridoxal phosphate enzyme (YggS family)
VVKKDILCVEKLKKMRRNMGEITQRVIKLKEELLKGNGRGEKVLLVAATKMQTVEAINEAIAAGVDAVAENKSQEFRDKNDFLLPCSKHFIGHLQTNKVKYLIGKIQLYHSCDRDELAQEIAKRSEKMGIVSNVLIQINIGVEESKGGYAYENAKETYARLSATSGLCVKGFMAMLPESSDEQYLRDLTRKMRALFDWAKTQSTDVEYLSMGMSGDYALCMEEGSNMIRVGSTIFGARNYNI